MGCENFKSPKPPKWRCKALGAKFEMSNACAECDNLELEPEPQFINVYLSDPHDDAARLIAKKPLDPGPE
jgi:hypothetical protein